jgi:hypothetical protein
MDQMYTEKMPRYSGNERTDLLIEYLVGMVEWKAEIGGRISEVRG